MVSKLVRSETEVGPREEDEQSREVGLNVEEPVGKAKASRSMILGLQNRQTSETNISLAPWEEYKSLAQYQSFNKRKESRTKSICHIIDDRKESSFGMSSEIWLGYFRLKIRLES